MSFDAFQNWVVQTGVTISVLILIILLIRRPFARAFGANAAYALWSLPLIRLVLPGLSVPETWLPSAFKAAEIEAPVILGPAFGSAAPAMPNQASGGADPVMTTLPSIGAILISIWLGAACVWLIYQLIRQAYFKSNLIARTAPPNAARAAEIDFAVNQVGLRRVPNVRVSPDSIGPLVTGVINPLVILPHDFETKFSTEQRNFALVHEFAHIKRGDLWVALLTLCFRAINWPNPLVHYASHKLRSDQEAACDAFVVRITGGQTAHSYAETLVKAARERGGSSQPPAHLALSLIPRDEKISKGD